MPLNKKQRKTATGIGIVAVAAIVGGALLATRKASAAPGGPSATITAQIISQGYLEGRGALMSGVAPITIQFTAAVSGGVPPYVYTWTFGDGSAAATGNPVTHTYATEADYTVSVAVTDQVGEKISASGVIAATATTAISLSGPTYAQTGAAVALSAVVKDDLGNALANETVTFFQGSSQIGTAVTGSNGVATFDATAPSSANPSTPYSASFGGTGDYLSGSASNTVEVYVYAPLTVSLGA